MFWALSLAGSEVESSPGPEDPLCIASAGVEQAAHNAVVQAEHCTPTMGVRAAAFDHVGIQNPLRNPRLVREAFGRVVAVDEVADKPGAAGDVERPAAVACGIPSG